MLPLVITVQQADGATRRYAFADSPVSVGRSPFAELQLSEPFISRWEGTLRFDAQEITYFSVGATNSTKLDGRALEASECDIALSTDSVLQLGELSLRFAREPVPESDLRRRGKRRPTREGSDTAIKTVYLEAAEAWAPSEPQLTAAAKPQLKAAPIKVPTVVNSIAAVSGTGPLAALRKPYAAARAALLSAVQTQLAGMNEEQRKSWLEELVEHEPSLASDPDLQPALQRAGLSVAGDIPELREWLRAIKSDLLPEHVHFDSRLTLTRVLGLLEALIQSLAEIHAAQDSVRKRWLGRSARRSLLQSERGNIVLAYLLNPQADWDERLRELEQSVREVVAHELALFRATLDGARTLLQAVSPETVVEASEEAAGAQEPGWKRWFVRGVRELKFWERFCQVHAELCESDQYERVFLGRVFARSYLAAMGAVSSSAGTV